MKKIIEVLRLKHEANLSHEKISRSCQLSKGVVSKYLSLARMFHEADPEVADPAFSPF